MFYTCVHGEKFVPLDCTAEDDSVKPRSVPEEIKFPDPGPTDCAAESLACTHTADLPVGSVAAVCG